MVYIHAPRELVWCCGLLSLATRAAGGLLTKDTNPQQKTTKIVSKTSTQISLFNIIGETLNFLRNYSFRTLILLMVGRMIPRKPSLMIKLISLVDQADSATQPRLHILQLLY